MNPEAAMIAFNEIIRNAKQPKVDGEIPPILFICGAPRSGTTFAYQALSHGGCMGSTTNLVARFVDNPVLGVRLAQALDLQSVYTGRSDYGQTSYLSEPHEFGRGWQSWLSVSDLIQPVDPPFVTAEQVNKIATFAAAWEKPVVFKSFAYLWFIERLSLLLPSSLWLHISRDVECNANSLRRLYQSRKISEEDAVWQSAVCHETVRRYSSKQLMERCIMQVTDLNAYIEQQLAKLPKHRQCSVYYEDYVRAPAAVTEKILAYFDLPRDPLKLKDIR